LGHPRPLQPETRRLFHSGAEQNTRQSCGTYQGNAHYRRKATFPDLGEVDDRGYIYNLDRAGSGLTTSGFTPSAARVDLEICRTLG
jgi:hypothetical protein